MSRSVSAFSGTSASAASASAASASAASASSGTPLLYPHYQQQQQGRGHQYQGGGGLGSSMAVLKSSTKSNGSKSSLSAAALKKNKKGKTTTFHQQQPPLEAVPLSRLCLACSDFVLLTDPRRRSALGTLWDVHQPAAQRRPPRLLRRRWSKFRGELTLKPIYMAGLVASTAISEGTAGTASHSCPLCDFFRAMCCGDCYETPRPNFVESASSSDSDFGRQPQYEDVAQKNRPCPYVVEESASQVLGVVVGELPIVPVFHLSFGAWSLRKHYYPNGGSAPQGMYFMDRDQPSGCVSPRKIGNFVDFELARTWIDFCDRNHRCRTDMVDLPGLRLLNCWTMKVEEWPVGSARPPFVAVSYVCGAVGEEEPSLEEELSPDTVPRLVDDVVRVVTHLGYEHVWMDRYCIPQQSVQVREQQIRRMDAILSMATVTIISAAGTSVHDGLHGVSEPRPDVRQAAIKVGYRTLIQLPTTTITREVESSAWSSRAWTYQEGILSRRRLVFTESQCYFQCCAMSCVEWLSMPLEKLPRPGHRRFFPAVQIPRLFRPGRIGDSARRSSRGELGLMIEEYAVRSLTFPDDRLDGFRGVLACFENAGGGSGGGGGDLLHASGVPVWGTEPRWGERTSRSDGIVAGLSWLCDYVDDAPPGRVATFPSWSWIGWDFSASNSPTVTFSYPFINGSPPACSGRGLARLAWVSEWPDAGCTTSITVEPGNRIVERHQCHPGSRPPKSPGAGSLHRRRPSRYRPEVLCVAGWWCHLELAPSFDTGGALRVLHPGASQDDAEMRLHTSRQSLKGLARTQRWKRTVYGQYRIRCWVMGLGYCSSSSKRTTGGGRGRGAAAELHEAHREVIIMALVEAGEWSTFERGDVFVAQVPEAAAGGGLDDVARAIGCSFGEFRLV